MNSSRMGSAHAWIRNNILGMVAIFIALSGSAAAATIVVKQGSKGSAKAKASKKAKPGPRGPAGAQGANGTNGAPGTAGTAGAQGPGAVRLDFDHPETDAQMSVIGTVNELTVRAGCFPAAGRADLFVDMQSSVGGATIHGTNATNNNGGLVTLLPIYAEVVPSPPNPGATIVDMQPNAPGDVRRAYVEVTYTNASRVISLQLDMVADDDVGNCEVHGTAVPAS